VLRKKSRLLAKLKNSHTYNSLVLDNSLFISLPMLQRVLWILKAYFTITRVSDHNAYESVNLWKCHAVTTLLFTQLAATTEIKCPSHNICLIGRNKKKGWKTFHHLTCHAAVHLQMKTAGVFHCPKDSWHFGRREMERSISVSFDRNIWDHLRWNRSNRNLPLRF